MHFRAVLYVLTLSTLLLAPDAETIVETAHRYLGRSYVYGGQGQRGFDCSGFVQHVFEQNGEALPRTSRDQAAVGTRVAWNEIQPGDLLFFTDRPGNKKVTHVGIALEDGKMIHASTGRQEIVVDTLDVDYYQTRRLFARRVLDGIAKSRAVPAHKVAQPKKPAGKKKIKARGKQKKSRSRRV